MRKIVENSRRKYKKWIWLRKEHTRSYTAYNTNSDAREEEKIDRSRTRRKLTSIDVKKRFGKVKNNERFKRKKC